MAVETTAAAVFTNLFAAGLARFGSPQAVFHKISYRAQKDQTGNKSRADANQFIARALHDLQIVIGTCYGPYTQELGFSFTRIR